MMNSDDNHIITALENAHEELKSKIPFSLVKNCYEVQKKFMFGEGGETPRQEISKLIKDYVDKELKEGKEE